MSDNSNISSRNRLEVAFLSLYSALALYLLWGSVGLALKGMTPWRAPGNLVVHAALWLLPVLCVVGWLQRRAGRRPRLILVSNAVVWTTLTAPGLWAAQEGAAMLPNPAFVISVLLVSVTCIVTVGLGLRRDAREI